MDIWCSVFAQTVNYEADKFSPYFSQSQRHYTCQGNSAAQRKDQLTALVQFQTAEDLYAVIAWKNSNHYKTRQN